MPQLHRQDPSSLRRGVAIDLNDLIDDDIIDHFKDMFHNFSDWREPKPSSYIHVDYLVRIDAEQYLVIPQTKSGMTLQFILENGLAIDTRYITRVARFRKTKYGHQSFVNKRGHHPLVIHDQTPRTAPVRAMRGSLLSQALSQAPGGPASRANHHYVHINQLESYVSQAILKWYPNTNLWLSSTKVSDVLKDSKTLHPWCKPVYLIDNALMAERRLAEMPVAQVWISINTKRLKAWLKRNRCRFYQSAHKYQAMLDSMQDEIGSNVAAMVEAENKLVEQETAQEADANDELTDEELAEMDSGPEEGFLPAAAIESNELFVDPPLDFDPDRTPGSSYFGD